MTITPADNPCNCRACGAVIFNEVTSMCEDCENDMNAHYDERVDGPSNDEMFGGPWWLDLEAQDDTERDRQMTVDNDLRENYGGA